MGTTARSGLMTFLPWIALVAVTVFAFAQMRGERPVDAPAPAGDGTPPAETAAPRAVEGRAADALRAADAALDDMQQALEAARARGAELETERAAVTRRAETAEARLDAATARLRAAETDLDAAIADAARLEAELAPLVERVVALEERRKVVEDRVLRMLADAAADDPERNRRAREAATRLGKDDLERLAVLVPGDAARAETTADLLASIPPSEDADGVAVAVLGRLEAGEGADARLARLGAEHLLRGALLVRLLAEDGAAAWQPALLAWLGRHASALDDEARQALAPPLAARLGDENPSTQAGAARLVGILRQEGQAQVIAGLLGSDDEAVRAAAAYALSRVPDRDTESVAAYAAVPALLADPALEVRLAGALLAEALLGRPVAFDASGDEATRRAQIEALPARP